MVRSTLCFAWQLRKLPLVTRRCLFDSFAGFFRLAFNHFSSSLHLIHSTLARACHLKMLGKDQSEAAA